MIVTTCFGLLQPSSGFHPKVWYGTVRYHTFGLKPDDGRNRPKHVHLVIIILY